jgi:cyclopropane fatty-acyl-phospholipid synthase-like methyltransferase
MACMRALSQTPAVLTSSEACERNKGPILEVLARELAAHHAVLEIGSGTGQHAVHFARHLPHLSWQPSEVSEQQPALAERIRLEGPANLCAPIVLDVRSLPWPARSARAAFDAVFTANTLHIMGWESVADFFRGAGGLIAAGGVLCVYGPFRYRGRYTSDSNAEFDAWLRARDPLSGIRDFEALDALARAQRLTLTADHAMPANNQTLVWRAAGVAASRSPAAA